VQYPLSHTPINSVASRKGEGLVVFPSVDTILMSPPFSTTKRRDDSSFGGTTIPFGFVYPSECFLNVICFCWDETEPMAAEKKTVLTIPARLIAGPKNRLNMISCYVRLNPNE